MALVKPRELLGHPERLICHNMAGNGECDGSKNIDIGQSAAKLPGNRLKVQRLSKVACEMAKYSRVRGNVLPCKKTLKI